MRRGQIEHVFDSGWTVPSRLVVMKGLWRVGGGAPRVSVVAGKQLGGAVVRNRARRRLAEALRQCEVALPEGLDAVLVARRPILTARPGDIASEVEELARSVERIERHR